MPYGSLERIAAIPGVKSVTREAQYEPAAVERHEGVAPEAYASSGMIGSGQFYTSAVAWAVEQGITDGMGDGTFGVDAGCNRAQVVTFLYRMLA